MSQLYLVTIDIQIADHCLEKSIKQTVAADSEKEAMSYALAMEVHEEYGREEDEEGNLTSISDMGGDFLYTAVEAKPIKYIETFDPVGAEKKRRKELGLSVERSKNLNRRKRKPWYGSEALLAAALAFYGWIFLAALYIIKFHTK